MYRAGLSCLLAAAVVLGAVTCTSSDLGQEPQDETANVSTSVRELTAATCSLCLDIHLGDYNLFLLEDYSGGRTVDGKVAAGGNITMNGLRVGVALPDDNVSNTLVAGGNLHLTNGNVYGATWYGGSYTPTPNWTVNFHRGTAARGTPISAEEFAARFTALRTLSSELATQRANGKVQQETWGALTLTGTDPCLNVFRVDASVFNGTTQRNIFVPAGSFTLINIHGTTDRTLSGGFNSSLNSRRTLYNFVDATRLAARNFGWPGTVLAPHARVTFNSGGWSGGLYAISLTGDATGNYSPLDDMAGAQAEVCNAVDDNCNGQVDEGFECNGTGSRGCTTSCGSTGTQQCSASCTWGACTPPAAEACNGADDTCDGQVDEGFECTGSGSRSCTAWCGAAGMQSCNPATCGYGECASASCCRADGDCAAGSYCEGSTCAAQRGNGAACTAANQCTSGQCVDGVCCDTACAGACDSCAQPEREGTCLPLPGGSEGAPSCAPYVCSGEVATCPSQCVQDSQCAEGHYCQEGACVATRDNGETCTAANQCTSGQCVDGVCCNSACDGACDACALEGSVGTCSLSPNTVECRTGSSCDVAEYCTGTSASCPADAFRPPGAECTSDSNACTVDQCNGAGSCTHPAVTPGTTCGEGQVCNAAGQCMAQCWIAGVPYEAGTINPSQPCQVCDPSQSTSTWSSAADGTSCGTSQSDWGSCGGFSDTCDMTGTQSRTVTTSTCGAGVCSPANSRPESRECTRNTEGVQCRAGGVCDVAEYCAGGSCPADRKAPAGTGCSDGNRCTVGDTCNSNGACMPGPRGSCGGPTYGPWSACSSSGGTCSRTGTRSRRVTTYSYNCDTGQCDASQFTQREDCDRDPTGVQCRAASSSCDVAEYCLSSSDSCPADGFAPWPVDCRIGDSPAPFGTPCTGGSSTGEQCDGRGGCRTLCDPKTSKKCLIRQTYRDVLNREVEQSGLDFWLRYTMQSCPPDGPPDDICDTQRGEFVYEIITSAESKRDRHPVLGSYPMNSCIYEKAFIRALYYDLLRRRNGDIQGFEIDFWSERLSSPEHNAAGLPHSRQRYIWVVKAFLLAPEYLGRF
jgi:choice-of-anchor A domain-containing protein